MSRPYIPPEQQFAAWSGVAFPKAPLPIDAQPPLSPSSASVRKESLPLSSRASSPRSSPPPPNLQRTWISEPPQPSYVGWERRAGSPPAKGAVSNRRSAPPNRRRYGWEERGGMKDDIRDFDPNHPSSRPLSVGLQRQSSYTGRSTNRHHSAPLARSASQGPPVRPLRPPSPTPFDLTLMPTYPFRSKYHVQKAKPLFSRASHDSAMSDVSAPFDLDLQPKSTPYSSFTVSNFNPHPTGSPKLEDFEFSQVAVASRVRRDDGSRGLGVATIIPVSRVSSPILFHPPSPIHSEPPSSVLEVRQASPSPPGSPNHSRPASYASSSSPLTLIRRNSSVYDPNPPISLPLVVSPPPAQPRVIADVDTLASRTSHVSMTPGYYGRIELLEKLEALLGCPLSVYESEEIIAIGGSNMMGTPLSKRGSRLSFIGLAPNQATITRSVKPMPPPAPHAPPASGGFFGTFRRALAITESTFSPFAVPPSPTPSARQRVVFGTSLSEVAQYGMVTSIIAGEKYDLPAVCFGTVEEIYRRGKGPKIPGLFRTPGDSPRVAKLIEIYNSPPDYGESFDLAPESIHNVTTLLRKYLRALPDPVLNPRLWRLFVFACIDSPMPFRRRIACAQLLIRLLPGENFSLFVYLLAFFAQAPLFPNNAVSLEDLSTLFGPSLLSPRTLSTTAKLDRVAVGKNPQENVSITSGKAQEGLLWLLVNWTAVSDGLLESEFHLDTDEILGIVRPRQEPQEQTPSEAGYDDLHGSPVPSEPSVYSPTPSLDVASSPTSSTATAQALPPPNPTTLPAPALPTVLISPSSSPPTSHTTAPPIPDPPKSSTRREKSPEAARGTRTSFYRDSSFVLVDTPTPTPTKSTTTEDDSPLTMSSSRTSSDSTVGSMVSAVAAGRFGLGVVGGGGGRRMSVVPPGGLLVGVVGGKKEKERGLTGLTGFATPMPEDQFGPLHRNTPAPIPIPLDLLPPARPRSPPLIPSLSPRSLSSSSEPPLILIPTHSTPTFPLKRSSTPLPTPSSPSVVSELYTLRAQLALADIALAAGAEKLRFSEERVSAVEKELRKAEEARERAEKGRVEEVARLRAQLDLIRSVLKSTKGKT